MRLHPIGNTLKMHKGVDLKAFYEPVYSMADGFVTEAAFGRDEGNYIKLSHGRVGSVYCHLSRLFCTKGQSVSGGTCIGISGNTGNSTGPHLHFGIKFNGVPVDPLTYLSYMKNQVLEQL